jgi:regulator of RNase E activity RraA
VTGEVERLIGYAVTSRIKTSNPPPAGHPYDDRSDWWNLMVRVPSPRIAVMQDIDACPGFGSILGEVHAAILTALHCRGVITNGAVRNIPGLNALNFQAFACHVTVSHGYCHMVDFGVPVEILGLSIAPASLLLADCHGVLSIPLEIAQDLPRIARDAVRRNRKIIDMCKSPDFSIEKLRSAIKETGNSL